MRQVTDLHQYQRKATEFQCSRPASALWLDPGLGKTVTTLTSINYLLQTQYVNAVLVVAPIRVCRLVWRQEALKWGHTTNLTFSMLLGTKDQRTRALLQEKNIYLINYENLGWLAEALHTYYIKKNKPLPFEGIVYDEISKCKNSTTSRVKSLMKILPKFKWRTGLTGTPASNGYKDLHGQYLVLDGGERLGTSKTAFRTRFYHKVGPYKEIAFDDTETTIKNLIGDMTLEMSADDYLTMPDFIVNDVMVEMEPDVRAKYERMEKEFFLMLDSGAEKEMFNKASLTNACLQYSNGAMYQTANSNVWEKVHDQKLEALEDILEECEGKPVLLSYAYRSDAERIMEKFKDYRPINLTECKSEKELKTAMERWQSGDCLLMIGHPLSMGHGIDGLQTRGHTLVWFGLNWSLDLYTQFNMRLHRQGQGHPVVCHRILCKDTLDQAQALALDEKATNENALRKAVRSYRENKLNSG